MYCWDSKTKIPTNEDCWKRNVKSRGGRMSLRTERIQNLQKHSKEQGGNKNSQGNYKNINEAAIKAQKQQVKGENQDKKKIKLNQGRKILSIKNKKTQKIKTNKISKQNFKRSNGKHTKRNNEKTKIKLPPQVF